MNKANETLLKLVIILIFLVTVIGNVFFLPNAFLTLRDSIRPQWGNCSVEFPTKEEKQECLDNLKKAKSEENNAQWFLASEQVPFRILGIVCLVLSVISLSLGKSKNLAKKYITFSGLAVFLSCILIL